MRILTPQRIFILMALLCSAQNASAAIVFLSGDVNIANFIDGSYGFPITAGNETFLRSVLGSGTKVLIRKEGTDVIDFGVHEANIMNSFYNRIPGVTSTVDSSGNPITSGSLFGVDLFLDILPRNSYSGSELAAVNDFLAQSGNLFFLGENNLALSEPNTFINQSLTALGSQMRLGNDAIVDGSTWSTSQNIVADPLTIGISSFGYAATNTVLGGNPLIQTLDSRSFVAYETIRATTVPEPTGLTLLGTVILFGLLRRRPL